MPWLLMIMNITAKFTYTKKHGTQPESCQMAFRQIVVYQNVSGGTAMVTLFHAQILQEDKEEMHGIGTDKKAS